MKSLRELYHDHQGKVSDKWSCYFEMYDRILSDYRDKPVSLLEIGVQNGGSLELWTKYFPLARTISGCDINPDCGHLQFSDRRIHIFVGDANSDDVYQQLVKVMAPFDIIIDDGSHTSGDVIKSFARYFPQLRPGGIYVAEDLHSSYWAEYEGGLYYPYASMAFFKRVIDLVNCEHWQVGKRPQDVLRGFANRYGISFEDELAALVSSVEFVNSGVVVRKVAGGVNKLGARVVAGSEAPVFPLVLKLRGQRECAPSQQRNVWSILEQAPEEQWEELNTKLICAQNRVSALERSLSWQMTKPLRYMAVIFKKFVLWFHRVCSMAIGRNR